MLRRTLALVLALTLALAGAPTHADSATIECRVQFLRELGWRVGEHDGAVASIDAGLPCERVHLGAALRGGDLVASLPHEPVARDAAATTLMAHPATQCAYRLRYAAATRAAIDRLVGNPRFRFTGLQTRWISFGLAGARAQGWKPVASFGRRYVPHGSNTHAINAFFHGQVRGECGLGRQVAQLATLAELFGPDGYDTAFTPEELSIGTFVALENSASVLRGSGAGRFFADGDASESAAMGRHALVGAPGFVVHVLERETLDDPASQALNFVVYDVDDAATAALRTHGGFARYNRLNRELWSLSRDVDPRDARGFERLLGRREVVLASRLSDTERATLARMSAILDDPFYAGFLVYVHHHGARPVGWHLARLLDRNPRTPYRIELALHNRDTEIFERYAKFRVGECLAAARVSP